MHSPHFRSDELGLSSSGYQLIKNQFMSDPEPTKFDLILVGDNLIVQKKGEISGRLVEQLRDQHATLDPHKIQEFANQTLKDNPRHPFYTAALQFSTIAIKEEALSPSVLASFSSFKLADTEEVESPSEKILEPKTGYAAPEEEAFKFREESFELFPSARIGAPLEDEEWIEGRVESPLITSLLSAGKTQDSLACMELAWNHSPREVLWEEAEAIQAKIRHRIDTFAGDSSIKKKLEEEGIKYVAGLTVGEYVRNVYLPLLYSGSCGNTANVLENIVHPTSQAESVPLKKAKNSSEFAGILQDKVKENSKGQWYCRVNAGPHAFLIEYNNNKFMIHQSYFGTYGLVDNIKRNRMYSVKEFLNLMILAAQPNPLNSSTQRFAHEHSDLSVVQARRMLFSSQSFTPDFPDGLNYRFVDSPVSPEVMQQRIEETNQKGLQIWKELADEPITSLVDFSEKEQEVPLVKETATLKVNTLKQLLSPDRMGGTKILDVEAEFVTELSALIEGKAYTILSLPGAEYRLAKIVGDDYLFEKITEESPA